MTNRFNKTEYLKNPDGRCPLCKYHDITGGFIEVENNTCSQVVFCSNCGSEWIDGYTLTHIDITSMPERYREDIKPLDFDHQGRAPTDLEAQAIAKIFEGYLPGIIVVYDHYISDGPGYAGWLAVTVSGEPQFCATFTEDRSGKIELCGQGPTYKPTEEEMQPGQGVEL